MDLPDDVVALGIHIEAGKAAEISATVRVEVVECGEGKVDLWFRGSKLATVHKAELDGRVFRFTAS